MPSTPEDIFKEDLYHLGESQSRVAEFFAKLQRNYWRYDFADRTVYCGPADIPQNEYDFPTVPRSELLACFYWEYARDSRPLLRLLQRHSFVDLPPSHQLRSVLSRGMLEFIYLVNLRCGNVFPNSPWQSLHSLKVDGFDGIANFAQLFLNIINSSDRNLVKICADDIPFDEKMLISVPARLVPVRNDPKFTHDLRTPVTSVRLKLPVFPTAHPKHKRSLLLDINWSGTDGQIANEITSKLAAYRPADVPEPESRIYISPGGIPIRIGEATKLEPDYRAALDGLGILRLRNMRKPMLWRHIADRFPVRQYTRTEITTGQPKPMNERLIDLISARSHSMKEAERTLLQFRPSVRRKG